jgi:hypothetical protein
MVVASEISIIEQAAAQVMGCEPEELHEETYDHYGLKVFSCHGLEYAIGTDEECDKAATDYIKQSLWTFNPNFIIDHSKLEYSSDIQKCIKEMQSKLCESANELVRALIEDMDTFVEDAISSDGRGMFLSPYDSNEQEIVIDGAYYYAYRLN